MTPYKRLFRNNKIDFIPHLSQVLQEIRYLSKVNHENIIRYLSSWIEPEYAECQNCERKATQDLNENSFFKKNDFLTDTV